MGRGKGVTQGLGVGRGERRAGRNGWAEGEWLATGKGGRRGQRVKLPTSRARALGGHIVHRCPTLILVMCTFYCETHFCAIRTDIQDFISQVRGTSCFHESTHNSHSVLVSRALLAILS